MGAAEGMVTVDVEILGDLDRCVRGDDELASYQSKEAMMGDCDANVPNCMQLCGGEEEKLEVPAFKSLCGVLRRLRVSQTNHLWIGGNTTAGIVTGVSPVIGSVS